MFSHLSFQSDNVYTFASKPFTGSNWTGLMGTFYTDKLTAVTACVLSLKAANMTQRRKETPLAPGPTITI